MDSQCQTYELPPTANHDACASLHDFLTSSRGKPVRLDGANVRRTSARMALLMLSARRAWAKDGHDFTIEAPSDGMLAGLGVLGLTAPVLDEEDAA